MWERDKVQAGSTMAGTMYKRREAALDSWICRDHERRWDAGSWSLEHPPRGTGFYPVKIIK